MMDDTTFGFRPGNLAALLGLGMTAGFQARPGPDTGERLRAYLREAPPRKGATVKNRSGAAKALSGRKVPRPGKGTGELLLASRTGLATIQAIKDYGKELAAKRQPNAQHAAGVTIYYAAIASALLFRNAKITRHSRAQLVRSFKLLSSKTWMPPELARHFAKAGSLAKRKAGPAG